jgi:hypothetical protein
MTPLSNDKRIRDEAARPSWMNSLAISMTVAMPNTAMTTSSPTMTASAGVSKTGEATTVADATIVVSFFISLLFLTTGAVFDQNIVLPQH